MKCNRCLLNINFETQYCPACGNILSTPIKEKVDINYYELFELAPNSTFEDIDYRFALWK